MRCEARRIYPFLACVTKFSTVLGHYPHRGSAGMLTNQRSRGKGKLCHNPCQLTSRGNSCRCMSPRVVCSTADEGRSRIELLSQSVTCCHSMSRHGNVSSSVVTSTNSQVSRARCQSLS